MEYSKLLLGTGLMMVYTWLLIRNFKRSGWTHALLRIDTALGIIIGIYLIATSIYSLFFFVSQHL